VVCLVGRGTKGGRRGLEGQGHDVRDAADRDHRTREKQPSRRVRRGAQFREQTGGDQNVEANDHLRRFQKIAVESKGEHVSRVNLENERLKRGKGLRRGLRRFSRGSRGGGGGGGGGWCGKNGRLRDRGDTERKLFILLEQERIAGLTDFKKAGGWGEKAP